MLSDVAVEELRAYSWPGNVRELQNCIARGHPDRRRHRPATASEPLVPATRTVPGSAPAAAPPASPWDQIDLSGAMSDVLRRVAAEVERRKIERAMRDALGNRMVAADALQVGFKALDTHMRQLGIAEG